MANHSLSRPVRFIALLVSSSLLAAGMMFNITGAAAKGVGSGSLPVEHIVPATNAAHPSEVDPALPPDDERTGIVRKGLALGHPDGACPGLLEAKGRNGSVCSHGPDAAPAGVDVRTARTVAELTAATKQATDTAAVTANGTGSVPCYGDGISGNRIEAIYARSSDKPDRYSSLASLFPQWAANSDAVFAASAAKTGGVRHLNFVTDPDCNLVVTKVTLSPTGDDDYNATIRELQTLGFSRDDRKYMVWVDANVYCGIASIRGDDQAGANNQNNSGRSWARVDSGCWGYYDSPEAHEIMHMMGGVQPSAPHGTSAWHCTDESDRMCYPDGTGGPMTYPCSSSEMLFDCGNDDYFHTSPSPTSYLGTHWNSAMNVFLQTSDPAGWTTTTTVPPPTTTTSNWSGSLKGKTLSKSYGVTSGAGSMVVSATGSGSTSMTLKVATSGGTVVGQTSGPSGVSLSVQVAAGSYTVTISGERNFSYALTVTRPSS